jgi:hypothetical protein
VRRLKKFISERAFIVTYIDEYSETGSAALATSHLVLFARAVFKFVGTGFSDLDEFALRARNIEHGAQFAVATGFFVVAGDPVSHEFAKDKDGRLDVVGERVVLEGRSVSIAHQVVDEPPISIGGFFAGRGPLEGLLALGGDPGGKDDIGVGGLVSHKLHGDIGAKNDFVVF